MTFKERVVERNAQKAAEQIAAQKESRQWEISEELAERRRTDEERGKERYPFGIDEEVAKKRAQVAAIYEPVIKADLLIVGDNLWGAGNYGYSTVKDDKSTTFLIGVHDYQEGAGFSHVVKVELKDIRIPGQVVLDHKNQILLDNDYSSEIWRAERDLKSARSSSRNSSSSDLEKYLKERLKNLHRSKPKAEKTNDLLREQEKKYGELSWFRGKFGDLGDDWHFAFIMQVGEGKAFGINPGKVDVTRIEDCLVEPEVVRVGFEKNMEKYFRSIDEEIVGECGPVIEEQLSSVGDKTWGQGNYELVSRSISKKYSDENRYIWAIGNNRVVNFEKRYRPKSGIAKMRSSYELILRRSRAFSEKELRKLGQDIKYFREVDPEMVFGKEGRYFVRYDVVLNPVHAYRHRYDSSEIQCGPSGLWDTGWNPKCPNWEQRLIDELDGFYKHRNDEGWVFGDGDKDHRTFHPMPGSEAH